MGAALESEAALGNGLRGSWGDGLFRAGESIMSYAQGSYKGTAVTGVAVAIGLFMLLRMCSSINSSGPAAPQALPDTPAGMERVLLNDPVDGPVFKALKRTYPQEFDMVRTDILSRSQEKQTQPQIAEAVLTMLIDIGKRHRRDIAQAPHLRLAAYRHAEIKVVETLKAANIQLCADYLIKGAIRTNDADHIDNKPLVDYRIATWEAGAEGRDHPVGRKVAAPGNSEWRAIADRMEPTIGKAGVTTFFDDAKLQRATPTKQCDYGLSYLKAINTLPAEQADGFLAYLVTQNG
jgi:hypothetical protein